MENQTIINRITRHLDGSGLSYIQHMKRAIGISLQLAAGSLFLCIHALFPFLLEETGTNIIKRIHDKYCI